MTRIGTLPLAALACLTLIPSIAQARYRGGDMNLYAYVSARPVNAVDPMGLQYGATGNPGFGGMGSMAAQIEEWKAEIAARNASKQATDLTGDYKNGKVKSYCCTPAEHATLVTASQAACRRAHKALYAIESFWDQVKKDKWTNPAMPTSGMVLDKSGERRRFYIDKLKEVYRACKTGEIVFECKTAGSYECRNNRGTCLFTYPGYAKWSAKDPMYVCPRFFTSRATQQINDVVHEFGRRYGLIFEKHTGNYEDDIYMWDQVNTKMDERYEGYNKQSKMTN